MKLKTTFEDEILFDRFVLVNYEVLNLECFALALIENEQGEQKNRIINLF